MQKPYRQDVYCLKVEGLQNFVAGGCVVENCHRYTSRGRGKVLSQMENTYVRWGLSATPWTEVDRDLHLHGRVGPPRVKIGYSQLVEDGWLVAPTVKWIWMPSKRYWVGAKWQTIYKDYVVENGLRNRIGAKFCNDLVRRGMQAMAVVRWISHGKKLLELLDNGAPLFGTSHTPRSRRQEVISRLRRGEPMTVVTTVGKEGLDLPPLRGVAIMEGGKSSIDVFQRLRVMTPWDPDDETKDRLAEKMPDGRWRPKDECFVLDFGDRAKYLTSHAARRLDLYRSEPCFEIEEVNAESMVQERLL